MRARLLALLAAAPLTTACMSGAIYTKVTVPLDVNLSRTPVYVERDETGAAAVSHLNIPLTNVPIDLLWNSRAIADAMAAQGIEEVYYADLETFSVLRIWNEYTVHVYGRPAKR